MIPITLKKKGAPPRKPWGSREERERRNRIQVAVFAYAYEFQSDSLVSDATFDAMCLEIDPSIKTGHKALDRFFVTKFHPDTGQWIHQHPELAKIAELYKTRYKGKTTFR